MKRTLISNLNYRQAKILWIVLKSLGLTREYVKINSQKQEFVEFRLFATYFLMKFGKMKYQEIATLFNRDRCTILNSINRTAELIETDKEFCKILHRIEYHIKLGKVIEILRPVSNYSKMELQRQNKKRINLANENFKRGKKMKSEIRAIQVLSNSYQELRPEFIEQRNRLKHEKVKELKENFSAKFMI